MKKRRVVITGMGLVSPLGHSPGELMERLYDNQSSVLAHPEWKNSPWCFSTTLSSPVLDFDMQSIPRKYRRTMSRISGLACKASESALTNAGLNLDQIRHENTAISYGSTMGGTSAIREYYAISRDTNSMVNGVRSTTFPMIMSHTCAANLALYFGIPGRVIASCTACAASTQSIGFAYEAIRSGHADIALAGGAEELDPAVIAVFDVLGATSAKFADDPDHASRPFDSKRDGIVVGEGAGTLILEEYSHARDRQAKIFGEVVSYYTNNDACHMTNPSVEGLCSSMRGALKNAELMPEHIGYINAHGTGTIAGDQAEAQAIKKLFGSKIPVSSLKGHFGHLMGACGVVESIACLNMLADQFIVGTKNLEKPDPLCEGIRHVMGNEKMDENTQYILKNSFAFGGINACLILKRSYNYECS